MLLAVLRLSISVGLGTSPPPSGDVKTRSTAPNKKCCLYTSLIASRGFIPSYLSSGFLLKERRPFYGPKTCWIFPCGDYDCRPAVNSHLWDRLCSSSCFGDWLGQFHVSGNLRTFTFNANTNSSGVTTGQTQGNNRNSGVMWHGTLTCLNVVGNVATMSGVVTDITPGLGDHFLVGNFIQFQVIDNGEGHNAPSDLISLTLFFPTGSTDPGCTVPQITATIPIEHGNVQIH